MAASDSSLRCRHLSMRLVQHFTELPRPCSYLSDRLAALEHRVLLDVSPLELEAMLIRGWRRFGPAYFRPACGDCAECVSIRIPVDRFRPTASQMRALARGRHFALDVAKTRVDRERLELYKRWHAAREEKREWEPSPLTEREYQFQFAFPHPAGFEMTQRDEQGRLVSCGIIDVTPRALSAVYFFYAPEVSRLSPGVANVLRCVELARERGIPHVYLGYRVNGCESMKYKAKFTPHELLFDRPSFEEEPRWQPA